MPSILPTLKPRFARQLLQLAELRDVTAARQGAEGGRILEAPFDAGGEIGRGGRIDQRIIPFGIGGEIRVSEEKRAVPAHRQQQRRRHAVVRQRPSIGITDAE